MTLNDQKNLYSQAWLLALASAAGVAQVGTPAIDDDSVDMTLKRTGGAGPCRSPHVGVQLKCTAATQRADDVFRFPLSIKNYDDLRDVESHIPKVLVVLYVPGAADAWITTHPTHSEIRKCAYWLGLAGAPAVANEHSVTVSIPSNQQLDVAALRAIFDRVAAGGRP